MAKGLRLRRFEQLLELKLLYGGAANRQRQRFGHENVARQHGQIAFLAVRDAVRRADRLVREERRAVGYADAPGEAARFFARNVEGEFRLWFWVVAAAPPHPPFRHPLPLRGGAGRGEGLCSDRSEFKRTIRRFPVQCAVEREPHGSGLPVG